MTTRPPPPPPASALTRLTTSRTLNESGSGSAAHSSSFTSDPSNILPSTSTVIANHSALSPPNPANSTFSPAPSSSSSVATASPRPRTMFGLIRESIRDIEKCSWLRLHSIHAKSDNRPRLSPSTASHFWAMFCVLNEREPVLELFAYKQSPHRKPTADASHRFSLLHVRHVSSCISYCSDSDQLHEFAITLYSCTVRLAAATRPLMLEWIDTLNQKLTSLHLLQPASNIYSKEPTVTSMASRPSTSLPSHYVSRPLPPIPTEPESNEIEQSVDRHFSSPTTSGPMSLPSTSTSAPQPLPPASGSSASPVPPRPARRSHEPILNCNSPSTRNRSGSSNQASPPGGGQTSSSSINDLTSDLHAFTIRSPLATASSDLAPASTTSASLSTSTIATAAAGPLSLRESQVLRLKSEMEHSDGVRLQLRQPNAADQLALVDWLGHVWLAGWRQKHLVHLHSALHIGDQLLRVSGTSVRSAAHAYSLIRCTSSHAELFIRRTPHANIHLIRRQFDRQPLGIDRDGNQAEVLHVHATGLAAQFGIPQHALAVDPLQQPSRVNWCITEINFRPLNLFFKRNEIDDRLNAVGREISLLLQPADLIRHLRKSLKQFKNYKEFLVQ